MLDKVSSFLSLHSNDAVPVSLSSTVAVSILEEFHGWDCIRHLGIRGEFHNDCALTSIEPRAHHLGGRSGGQFVNGPTILSIIDACMVLISLAHGHPGKVATINISTSFLNPIPNEKFYCMAIATKRSRSLVHCQATVFSGAPAVSATANGIVSVMREHREPAG